MSIRVQRSRCVDGAGSGIRVIVESIRAWRHHPGSRRQVDAGDPPALHDEIVDSPRDDVEIPGLGNEALDLDPVGLLVGLGAWDRERPGPWTC